ncbi:D-inositol-3-phosphate glycosyltransferase (plasmid) [Pseudoseohaeicola sp. NH-UV-7]|uniref:glycosyltransferase family 4 protein n=1 Tax=Sulfitobacter sp. TBRI5 TaxID=2989732 RepID=UPI003A639505
MIPIAFYAPLKSPRHPVPSGDRAMARAVMQALDAGPFKTDLVSQLRSLDRSGDPTVQTDLQAKAQQEIERLLAIAPQCGWRAWVTYHNYYKAPDLIGPAICASLSIPYIQIEASRAHKRLTGPWAAFAKQAEAACDQADLVFHMTTHDRETLMKHQTPNQTILPLAPFLPQTDLPVAQGGPRLDNNLLCVGMMRAGDKLASYQIIADAAGQLKTPDWRLTIVGAGPARAGIEAAFAPFGPRVRFTGQLDADELARHYDSATLLVWPGVNEAFGMTYLEAQAHGLPIVAQDRNGVRDVVHGGILCDPAHVQDFAAAIDRLLGDPAHRATLGAAGRAAVQTQHLQPAATDALTRAICPLIGVTP